MNNYLFNYSGVYFVTLFGIDWLNRLVYPMDDLPRALQQKVNNTLDQNYEVADITITGMSTKDYTLEAIINTGDGRVLQVNTNKSDYVIDITPEQKQNIVSGIVTDEITETILEKSDERSVETAVGFEEVTGEAVKQILEETKINPALTSYPNSSGVKEMIEDLVSDNNDETEKPCIMGPKEVIQTTVEELASDIKQNVFSVPHASQTMSRNPLEKENIRQIEVPPVPARAQTSDIEAMGASPEVILECMKILNDAQEKVLQVISKSTTQKVIKTEAIQKIQERLTSQTVDIVSKPQATPEPEVSEIKKPVYDSELFLKKISAYVVIPVDMVKVKEIGDRYCIDRRWDTIQINGSTVYLIDDLKNKCRCVHSDSLDLNLTYPM